MDHEDIIWEVKKEGIRNAVLAGKRMDGRAQYEYRPVEVKTDYIKRAEGSALVKLGKTQVLVGVKMDIGTPYPDTPNHGNLITNAEMGPIAAPVFTPGPPDENAIELARVVDRGIRESGMIDTEKLCITEGELVWNVLVDVHVLDYDGNLFDAASLGATAALHTAKIPKLEGERVIYSERKDPLPVKWAPIAATFVRIDRTDVLDPSLGEEKSMDGRLTLITRDDGALCAAQKGGPCAYKKEEIEKLFDIAVEKTNELRKKVIKK